MKSYVDIAYLLIGGRNAIPEGPTTIADNSENVLQDVTGANESTDRWAAVKHRTFEMTQEGFFDRGTSSWHEALNEKESVLMYAPNGNELGDELIAFAGVRSTYNKLPARGEFHKASATYKAEAGPERECRILAPLLEYQGSDETGELDWGDDSEDGAIYLSVTNLDATDVTVVVEHFDDDTLVNDWVTLESFTVVSSAPAAERKEVTGTIHPLTRVSYVISGGNEKATFTVGLARR